MIYDWVQGEGIFPSITSSFLSHDAKDSIANSKNRYFMTKSVNR